MLARLGQVLLQVDRAVAEGPLGLLAGGLELAGDLGRRVDDAHAAPAAAAEALRITG